MKPINWNATKNHKLIAERGISFENIVFYFEAGEFKSVLTPKRKKMLQAVAEETFKKDKRINIRILSRDLESLQRRALEEGIPYQTLVSSVLHKYVSGGLQDIDVANKALHRTQKHTAELKP